LADWIHESNASDYNFPKGSLYEDFGVHCCGVPSQNFQAQLGFFLNLSHDACGCGASGCSKEEYFCCWGNNYLYGNQTKECTDGTTAYVNSFLTYFNMVGAPMCSGGVSVSKCDVPYPIKTNGRSISCGAQDPIEIYKDIIAGNDPDPDIEPDDPPVDDVDGICCALKITGKESLQGDYESISNKTCEEIWEVGRSVYSGRIEYSIEIPNSSRSSCEKQWGGVCCDNSGEYEWVPSSICSNKASEYSTYDSCMEAGGERVELNLNLEKGNNFTAWILEDSSNPVMASNLLSNSSISLVSGFHNGVWDQIMFKEDGSIKGIDFKLESGEAYLIITSEATDISLSGVKFNSYNWNTSKGWQFVPAGALNPYTNTRDVVLSFEDANISQIAIWKNDLGLFKYFVYDVSGEKFGESESFTEAQGVFVRID
ncbi:MAG: hypothetical protein RBR74_13020, partial [Ignavibacteriaceae bacterium]|nr:hypothetical protein [Ignavibacteriaceae bacterium]